MQSLVSRSYHQAQKAGMRAFSGWLFPSNVYELRMFFISTVILCHDSTQMMFTNGE